MAQDTPTGNVKSLESIGSMSKKPVHPFVLVKVGLKNYRSWVLAVIYALTGGTEVRNCIWSVSNPQKLRHPV